MEQQQLASQNQAPADANTSSAHQPAQTSGAEQVSQQVQNE